MVYTVFTEKKKEFANEAKALLSDVNTFLGIKALKEVRVINRYSASNISPELFDYAKKTVFSEPQTDIVSDKPIGECDFSFAVEYLPGQFDQRADSAAQCIQMISCGERPTVRTAKIYMLHGDIKEDEIKKIKAYVINPVESREASMENPTEIDIKSETVSPPMVLDGFIQLTKEELEKLLQDFSLAMDIDDLLLCQSYFKKENRNPTVTEIRVIDTYWSDHCRHTTFLTQIGGVKFSDKAAQKEYEHYLRVRKELGRSKPICLMDIATVAAKYLKKQGLLEKLDESEEINACTVKTEVEIDGKKEPWLLLFKNETHNHPTEIEPFGGAATCIGGAIRDPLSGRAYVYGAMRVTGAADPLTPVEKTIKGKLPQRKIVTGAAAGYSSYGNQIGLATGIVDEIYHPGYAAKHMEIGAVIGAAPQKNVRRERPAPGDKVILIGGATGRDGCGGATGSSKSHDESSLEKCGAQVQKGNAPEERKLQRLFRNAEASRMIKRCNDFGAGGVSVAIGELADGLLINLNAVPKKYEGLDATELAISESQERMAVVVEDKDVQSFLSLADEENLSATVVAEVTDSAYLVMEYNKKAVVNISREFLNSNGAQKHIDIEVEAPKPIAKEEAPSFEIQMRSIAGDLNICSKRGLAERFDSTIGAGSVLMPFGGKYQLTPVQSMVQKVSLRSGHTDDCSLMAYGYNPYLTERSPFCGAYTAVLESVGKLVATGADLKEVYLTFQEYFEKPGADKKSWGKPLAALLGAFKAQTELKIAAIGGKDSMSGSFENLCVPPTLVSFAVTMQKAQHIISPEFKKAGNRVVLISPLYDENNLADAQSFLKISETVARLVKQKKIISCYTPGMGGIGAGIMKMCMGNMLGFEYSASFDKNRIFKEHYASFIAEVTEDIGIGEIIGNVKAEPVICCGKEAVSVTEILPIYENKLESVYSCNIKQDIVNNQTFTYNNTKKYMSVPLKAKPRVVIPVFPGTNCEYDSARAAEEAGFEADIFVINNKTPDSISKSAALLAKKIQNAQTVFLPGGFSGGDEPDGSGKFITAFFRNAVIKESITNLLDVRGGLMCGICNGFQALIKLGLVPYGKITDTDEKSPTLTFNTIARHQSRIVRTRVASNMSPWLSLTNPGEVYMVPVSHGEGRFVAEKEFIQRLAKNGQIATQYVDFEGNATDDIHFNPNGSMYAIEGITSPDGRVFGKMGHSERIAENLYKNVSGNYDIKMFKAAARYFK